MRVSSRRAVSQDNPVRLLDNAYVDQPIRDLSRNAYCVLGLPIDAIDMASALCAIHEASTQPGPFLVSTVNLNYLANSLTEPEFRESVLQSDLCTADGMPIVWISRLLGLPITKRIAGADVLDALRQGISTGNLGVFFFGGADGIADSAGRILNVGNGRLTCLGALNPGYCTVEDMSSDKVIATINASKADFLVVALGASKGQAWLLHNHYRLRIPVRAHLGAALNFQAGSLKRAPRMVRTAGLEWLWRIKEEPHLWVRYRHDGRMLLRLFWTRLLPLVWQGRPRWRPQQLEIVLEPEQHAVALHLSGDAVARYIDHAIGCFQQAVNLERPLVILDLAAVRQIDQRFLGLILMLRKVLHQRGATLLFIGISDRVRRIFHLNELEFLLRANWDLPRPELGNGAGTNSALASEPQRFDPGPLPKLS
jgi:N-acetylglucosaminyldiphosphoundecaprenol N-acetyl-beta-D-mannosaminyltransferase